MGIQEIEKDVLIRLTNIESMLASLLYPNTGGKPTTKAPACISIPKPFIATQEEIYKDVIQFAKDLQKYSVDKNQIKGILSKYTRGSISSIPFDELQLFVDELSTVELKDAIVDGNGMPF